MDQNTAYSRARRRVEETRRRSTEEKLATDFHGTMESIDKAFGLGKGVVREIPLAKPHTSFEDKRLARIMNKRLAQLHQTRSDLAYRQRQARDAITHGRREKTDETSDDLKEKLVAGFDQAMNSIDQACGNPMTKSEYQMFAPRRISEDEQVRRIEAQARARIRRMRRR